MALVLDTGALFASIDQRDAHYQQCRAPIERTDEDLVVPSPVVFETAYLLTSRGLFRSYLTFLRDLEVGAYVIVDLWLEDYARIRAIREQYSDFDIGFVDAAVLAIVERLNEPKLATLDRRHFSALRPRHVEALELLP